VSLGKLIALEGIDGAGTTTQAALLREAVEAHVGRCLLTREPSDGPIGTQVRQVLRGRLLGGGPGAERDGASGPAPFDRRALALLFAADRLDHLQAEVRISRSCSTSTQTRRWRASRARVRLAPSSSSAARRSSRWPKATAGWRRSTQSG